METRTFANKLLFGVASIPYAVLTAQPTWREHGGRLAELVGVRPGDALLDLGCGPGESAFGMAERVPGVRVTGLDLSDPMISIARFRARRDPQGAATTFVQGDAMNLPFGDASFDAITGHSFLYLVPDADRVLAEAARVLKPGGRCAFLEPARAAETTWLPREIVVRAPREPRFVTSMALWRIVSRGYGRFDDARFREVFDRAGFDTVDVRTTLGGLGVFGVGRRR